MSKMHRVFVEWPDGCYISSLAPDFGAELVRMVEEYGRPSLVEFRADDEGWVGPEPCKACGEDLVDCECGEPL